MADEPKLLSDQPSTPYPGAAQPNLRGRSEPKPLPPSTRSRPPDGRAAKKRRPPWRYALSVFAIVIVVGFALAMRHDDHMEERGKAVGQAAMLAAFVTYVLAWIVGRKRSG